MFNGTTEEVEDNSLHGHAIEQKQNHVEIMCKMLQRSSDPDTTRGFFALQQFQWKDKLERREATGRCPKKTAGIPKR